MVGAQHKLLEPGMWYMSVIPALKSWRQEDLEFQASLGYL
jgi:hypothetical protein